MAEGGEEENEKNPFSFKSYVKKKSRTHEDEDIDTDDIFAATAPPSTRKKDQQPLIVDDGEIFFPITVHRP